MSGITDLGNDPYPFETCTGVFLIKRETGIDTPQRLNNQHASIPKLGQMGKIVKVCDGYARNYLLPSKKALRANKANKARFETERSMFEAQNLDLRLKALELAEALKEKSFIVIRSAGETGHLYGSVSTRDIVDILSTADFSISRSQIHLNTPIKSIGLYKVAISLHAEVEIEIKLNIVRSAEEAERQEKSESSTSSETAYAFDEKELEPQEVS